MYAVSLSCVITYNIWECSSTEITDFCMRKKYLKFVMLSSFVWLYFSIKKYFKHYTSKMKLVILCDGLAVVDLFDRVL